MRILAIDPGPVKSAFVVWDGQEIIQSGIWENHELLGRLYGFRFTENAQVVIEMIASYGMAVGASVFETCVWIGRFVQCWNDDTTLSLVKRKDIKLHHCHSPRANDATVRAALIDKYGEPGTKKQPGLTYGLKKDLWQAFALATYWTEGGYQNAA